LPGLALGRYQVDDDQSCSDHAHGGIKITSLYYSAGMIKEGDRIISLSGWNPSFIFWTATPYGSEKIYGLLNAAVLSLSGDNVTVLCERPPLPSSLETGSTPERRTWIARGESDMAKAKIAAPEDFYGAMVEDGMEVRREDLCLLSR
jgi:hypothetical protein